ncbi:hypothetical protein Q6348_06610 [Isoptericola sp. b441]|uniref:Transporter n=1 Tax=Actinotalea lenta TaxID=3064654 RepID=A0ABT9D7M5_9CELL|nr:hypothetical protein [Isoptericola sp. b441]MDO8106867.1 hypothetical protein [Isoptericola sp. b441]
MVEHLVRLKLTLLRNGLRRSPWQIVGMVVGALYGVMALIGVGVGIVALALSTDASLRRAVLVVGGSAVVLGWAVLPMIAFGVDATLDPARFVTFPVPTRRLLAGLGLAALIGVPGVVTVLGVLGASVVWWREPVVVPVAMLTGLLAVAVAVVASRATTTTLASVLSGRRTREASAFAFLVLLAAAYLGFGRLTTGGLGPGTDLRGLLSGVADVLGWTPVGAAWAAPADAAAGAWGTAVLRTLVLVASLAALLVWWDRAMARALVRPASKDAAAGAHGLGMFARLPATPLGAVTARCLTYWRRDPRYILAVAAVPLVPIAMYAFGSGSTALWFLPMMTGILGWSIAADTSSDGTAFWAHVAAPLRGVDDRLGRAIAAGLVLVPLAALLVVVLGVLTGHADDLPALLGVGLGTLGVSLGVASVMSALVVMRVQQSGENVFGTRQGGSVVSVLSQLVGMLAVLGLSSPVLGLCVLAVVRHSAVLGWSALVVGLALGATVLTVGVRWGGRLLDRRAPVILQEIVSMV